MSAFEPATPRPAASLILVDPGPNPPHAGAPRVLMGRRPSSARFMPGFWVFPGGALEPQDRSAAWERALDPRCVRLGGEDAAALAACAVRETREETGLPARLRGDALRFFFRAVTPPSSPVRFDARFFVGLKAELLSGDAARGDGELEAVSWVDLMGPGLEPLARVTRLILAELRALWREDGPEGLLDRARPAFETVHEEGAGQVRRIGGAR